MPTGMTTSISLEQGKDTIINAAPKIVDWAVAEERKRAEADAKVAAAKQAESARENEVAPSTTAGAPPGKGSWEEQFAAARESHDVDRMRELMREDAGVDPIEFAR